MKHRSMFGVAIGLVALVLATVACGQEPTPTATLQFGPVETRTPAEVVPEPVPGPYDGTWVGVTGQGLPITVTVMGDVVASVAFEVIMIAPTWTAHSERYHPLGGIIDRWDHFEATAQSCFKYPMSQGVVELCEWGVSIDGGFEGNALTGVLEVKHLDPNNPGAVATTTTEFAAVRAAASGQEV